MKKKNWQDEDGEPRKYLLSEKTITKIKWFLIISGLLIFGGGAFFIYTGRKNDRASAIQNLEVHDVIAEIIKVKNDVPWYRGRMGNGELITLPMPMVYSAAVGDSIIKEKGNSFFVLKKKLTNKTSKWNF